MPGSDAITAFADANDNGTRDPGEPAGAATKIWALPVTTPLCEVTVTNGGWIIAANGDQAHFGGNAKSSGLRVISASVERVRVPLWEGGRT